MAGALSQVRVLELGNMVSAAYATKLMADLGAEVVKVEEPGGDLARARGPFPGGIPDANRSGLFLYLNTNKDSITLDLAGLEGQRRLRELAAGADILVHNYSPAAAEAFGLVYAALSDTNPRLVMCSITPFGLDGPHRNFKASELTMAHAGGWAWLSPGNSQRADLPPLKAAGRQCDFQAGLTAAITSLAAYHSALERGIGEHVDLSVQEVVAAALEQNFVHYTYSGLVASRLGRYQMYPQGFVPCRDGLIYSIIAEQDQWKRLVELMGTPEWASWEVFGDPYSRGDNADVLRPLFEEWTRQWPVSELYHAGQARKLCFAPIHQLGDLTKSEQLQARVAFVEVDHTDAGRLLHPGAPYQLREKWWSIRKPAPRLNEGTPVRWPSRPRSEAAIHGPGKAPRPLEGIRVADFGWVWAGPFCTLQLAHLGAEVIKIESEARLDIARRVPAYPGGMEPGINRSGFFNQWNQAKKSLTLNLGEPGARQVALDLVRHCDVVVENFGVGVMDRLGLGYDELRRVTPGLVMASISGYGQTGPLRNYMAYGPAMGALAGLSALTGYPDGGPELAGISYGDPNGALHAATAICAALIARRDSGQGQYIDLSLWEAMLPVVAEGWMDFAMNGIQPPRIGNRDPLTAPHNCFPARGNDEWVAISCETGDEWRALCSAIERADLAADDRFGSHSARKRNEDELEKLIEQWTRKRTKWEVTRVLQDAGVAAFPSMSSKDLVEDAHLNSRGFFARLPHPEVGARTHAGIPWRMEHSPNGVRAPAPLLGQDNRYVLCDILGYSPAAFDELTQSGVLC